MLILDEALAVLDIGLRKMVFETLRRYARENIVLLISHHSDQLRSADRLLVLHPQGIQELPTPSRIDDSELARLVDPANYLGAAPEMTRLLLARRKG